MVAIRLYYLCPVHGTFTVRAALGAKWTTDKQCPQCGALSPREHRMTAVIHDEGEQG